MRRKSKKEDNKNNNEDGFEDLFNRFDGKWVDRQLGKSKFNSEQTAISEEANDIVNNTARAIFNSNCEITYGTDLKTDEALREDLQNIIRIKHGARIDYIIKADGNLKPVDEKCNGTLLKIDCGKYKQVITSDNNNEKNLQKGIYVRFRVSHPQLEKDQLKKGGVTSGTLLDAPSSNTLIQYMQRVNDIRSLPHEILDQYHDIGKQYIGKAMSMIALSRKYEIDDEACYKIRQLEYDLHKMYIPDGFIKGEKKDSVNIYQWNAVNRKPENERTSSMVFNIKIRREKSTAKDWLRYIFIGMFSSVVTILFSQIISHILPSI